MAILLGHDVDRVERAQHAAVLAITSEARVEMHLVRPRMDDVAPVPARVIPLGRRATVEHVGLVITLFDDRELVGRDPNARKIERRFERRKVTRVERRHEFVEARHRRSDLGLVLRGHTLSSVFGFFFGGGSAFGRASSSVMNSKASVSFSRSSSTRTVPPSLSLPNRISSASGFLM